MDSESEVKNGSEKRAGEKPEEVIFKCLGQAVKDISFECPVAAYEAGEMSQDMDLSISVTVAPKEEGSDFWLVTLALRAQMKSLADKKETTLFLAELAYSGVFVAKGIANAQRAGLLHVEGASMLYPFARHILMQLIAEGGYRPPVLDPINFLTLYHQSMQKTEFSTNKKSD